MDVSDYQRMQSDFDDQYFDLKDESCFDQVRHILLHLSCTVGKLARLCEMHEHRLLKDKHVQLSMSDLSSEVMMEVIPDLLIHSMQLARCMDLSLSCLYMDRLEYIRQRRQSSEV